MVSSIWVRIWVTEKLQHQFIKHLRILFCNPFMAFKSSLLLFAVLGKHENIRAKVRLGPCAINLNPAVLIPHRLNQSPLVWSCRQEEKSSTGGAPGARPRESLFRWRLCDSARHRKSAPGLALVLIYAKDRMICYREFYSNASTEFCGDWNMSLHIKMGR